MGAPKAPRYVKQARNPLCCSGAGNKSGCAGAKVRASAGLIALRAHSARRKKSNVDGSPGENVWLTAKAEPPCIVYSSAETKNEGPPQTPWPCRPTTSPEQLLRAGLRDLACAGWNRGRGSSASSLQRGGHEDQPPPRQVEDASRGAGAPGRAESPGLDEILLILRPGRAEKFGFRAIVEDRRTSTPQTETSHRAHTASPLAAATAHFRAG